MTNVTETNADVELNQLLATDVDMDALMDDGDAESVSITLNSIYPAGSYLAQIVSSSAKPAKNADGYAILINGKPRIGSHALKARLLYDIDRAKRVSGFVDGTTYEFSTTRMALMDTWEVNRGRLLSSLAIANRYQSGLDDDGTLLTPQRIRELKVEAASLIKQGAEGFKMKDIHASSEGLLVRIYLKEEPARSYKGKEYDARNSFSPEFIDPPTNEQYNMVVGWNQE